VKYKTRVVPSIEASLGRLAKKIPALNIRKIKLKKGVSIDEAIRAFQSDPMVEYAEPNYIVHINAVTPDDPLFDRQWYMPKVDAPDAWQVNTTAPQAIVAVIDTGVDYRHPDLSANIWANPDEVPANGIDDDGNGFIDDVRGWDFVNNDNDPMDDNGHGTTVSGIIGAVGNNGIGMAGSVFSLQMMPLKVLDFTGSGPVDGIIEAIQYANMKGTEVANCSFGFSGGFSQALKDAITNAPEVLFSCAAGNSGRDNDTMPEFPASLDNPNIISVASSGKTDDLSIFSNFGLVSVDVAAPGEFMESTVPIRETVFEDNFDALDWTVSGPWALSSSFFTSPPTSLAQSHIESASPNTATSPMIDLTGRDACILIYELKLSIPTNGGSGLFPEASGNGGATWTGLDNFILNSNTEELGPQLSGNIDTFNNGIMAASLDRMSGKNMLLRFRLTATSGFVYIDDVRVNCASTAYNGSAEYSGGHAGTSFSAPMVSGTSALLKGKFTGLSALDMKRLIMAGVDVLPSMTGLTATGGRLNMFKSFLPPPPSDFHEKRTDTEDHLTWMDDPNEDSYVLERRTAESAFEIIATPPQNTTSYTDTGLQKGTTYFYRLKAVNSVGESAYVEPSPAPPEDGDGGGGGCFIATAAFESPLSKEVATLRHFRDQVLLKSRPGRAFVKFYYRFSPPLARYIARHKSLRAATRLSLYPVVYSIKHPRKALFLAVLLFSSLGFTLLKIVKYRAMNNPGRKGFTLLEILIVVAILSMLALIVAPKIIGRTDDAKVAEAQVQIRNFETGLKLFKLDNGFYPSTEQGLAALTEKPASGKIPSNYREGGYLEQKKIPADPWGNPYVYISPGLNGDYDLSSLGADGKEGGEGYDKDIKSWELK
jgi:type II secretion system protein G